jgi:hypothetical protein
MTHFGHSVVARRTTSSKWLKVGASIGSMVNEWSGRDDLTVFVGPWVGMDHGAPAAYNPATSEIEVNSDIAFDHGNPEVIGDFTRRVVQLENPKATGAIYHEACHARYSQWPLEATQKRLKHEAGVWDAMVVLEEIRIEARGILERPENQIMLRASAMGIVMSDLKVGEDDDIPKVRQAAKMATLILGRRDVGILRDEDVVNVRAFVGRVLSDEVVDALARVWSKFAVTSHGDVDGMIDLARDWNTIITTEAERQGQSPGGKGEMMLTSKQLGEMLDALGEDGFTVTMAVESEAGQMAKVAEYDERSAESKSKANERAQAKTMAREVFQAGVKSVVRGSSTSSKLVETRAPNAQERQAAVLLARQLEKARYRDRVRTESASRLPPGRLRTRALVQGQAQRARGMMVDVQPWNRVQHRHVDNPPLTIGVMVDISGSMGSAMKSMASTAWVLSEAVRRVQGRVAMVYYGSSVFSTLKPGQHLNEVQVYTAPDSTEEFDKAFLALDGGLTLTEGKGARLLIIVSDGQYRLDQVKAVDARLAQAARAGVGVLWLGAGDYGLSKAKAFCTRGSAEFVPLGNGSVVNVVEVVGRLAAKALTTAGTGR